MIKSFDIYLHILQNVKVTGWCNATKEVSYAYEKNISSYTDLTDLGGMDDAKKRLRK